MSTDNFIHTSLFQFYKIGPNSLKLLQHAPSCDRVQCQKEQILGELKKVWRGNRVSPLGVSELSNSQTRNIWSSSLQPGNSRTPQLPVKQWGRRLCNSGRVLWLMSLKTENHGYIFDMFVDADWPIGVEKATGFRREASYRCLQRGPSESSSRTTSPRNFWRDEVGQISCFVFINLFVLLLCNSLDK